MNLDPMSGLSDLVAGGFDTLGYIPVGEAVQMCEGQARWRLERELDRKVFKECFEFLECRD